MRNINPLECAQYWNETPKITSQIIGPVNLDWKTYKRTSYLNVTTFLCLNAIKIAEYDFKNAFMEIMG